MSIHTHNEEDFCLEGALAKISLYLPLQGPIKDFIHLNILQNFMDKPFYEALDYAAKLFGAQSYMPMSYYKDKYQRQEISNEALEETIKEEWPYIREDLKNLIKHAALNFLPLDDEVTFNFLLKNMAPNVREKILNECQTFFKEEEKSSKKIPVREFISKQIGLNLDHLINPILFRLSGAYLDQGVALWQYFDGKKTFRKSIHDLALKSKFPLALWASNSFIADFLSKEPEQTIALLLEKILATKDLYFDYIKESLLAHRGWAGMINVVSQKKHSLARECSIDMKEFLAFKLILEWQAINHYARHFVKISSKDLSKPAPKNINSEKVLSLAYFLSLLDVKQQKLAKDNMTYFTKESLLKIWALALEKTFYEKVAQTISTPFSTSKHEKPIFQAVFCLDDRECAFRQLLEDQSPAISTYGTAGFFGIDAYLMSKKKAIADKICPPDFLPEHILLEEEPASTLKKPSSISSDFLGFTSYLTHHGANSLLLGFISIHTLGHFSLFSLITSFFHPKQWLWSSKTKKAKAGKLIFERKEDRPKLNGKWLGYTTKEMADRVFNLLQSINLIKDFSPMIFFIGHGSSSTNNPHFAAYDCGACSGRPGNINARAFCAMANLSLVREEIAKRGLLIPTSTIFVPALHDTCTDEVEFFDLEPLNKEQISLLNVFKNHLANAQKKNAAERCRKFALVDQKSLDKMALHEVKHRSRSLFEPRPELGHQTNTILIVGRRERTYKLGLDRRAFLQSYNCFDDNSGNILQKILSAAIPVCGGINLDYYFSRLDAAVYGSGSKLSHNVTSLIGVGHGLDDDLRTGLPVQMTELHEPIRLLVIVEQTQDMLINVLERNPNLCQWVYHDWVKLANLDPNSNQLFILKNPVQKNFVPLVPRGASL